MANREKGEVSLKVGETSYTLVLTTAAMIAAEDEASTPTRDVTWDEIMSSMVRGSAKYVRLFIWAMLRKYHQQITVTRAGELIDEVGGIDALRVVLEAGSKATTPDPADLKSLGADTKRPRKARVNGTGGSSISRPVVSA